MECMSNIANMDDAKPSLFELLSESQFRELLEPSLRYLLAIATRNHPRYLIRFLNHFDEVYALLVLLLERHYLRRWGGSFTENFYGLKRTRVLTAQLQRAETFTPALVTECAHLRRNDVWKSLLVIVVIPYLKRKLDVIYENYAGGAVMNVLGQSYQREELTETSSSHERFLFYVKKLLCGVYPHINAVYYFSRLVFNLTYLFNKSACHSPLDFLINIRVRRMIEADNAPQPRNLLLSIQRASRVTAVPRNTLSTASYSVMSLLSPSIFARIFSKLLESLKVLVPTSIFFLKFLEWWYSSDFARQLSSKTAASMDLPPPVAVKTLSSGERNKERTVRAISLEEDNSELCPVCDKPITNPTAVQTGYVCCYPCVFRWVQDREGMDGQVVGKELRMEQCPVTGVRLLGGTEGLRRLMI
ncbi:Pex12 amino terminal region-domain-containing protein [Trichophaea hybrida]|nr:Pex12 amino terminal region-domain-containing protein [Trichophaea hybrida]